jgi:glyoxylase-like metal-dependent hydrolase (beta-lactamase superfamily II)
MQESTAHDMFLEQLVVGPFSVNCYLIGCPQQRKMAVIDPGGEAERIWRRVQDTGFSLEYIINTHGHVDHIAANADLKQKSQARILAHADDVLLMTTRQEMLYSMFPGAKPSPAPDQLLSDGQIIHLGNISLQVLHTPGHTQGGICLLTDGVLFTGDTLFADGIGRTDFPGGSYHQLISSIQNKLFCLDGRLKVLPGHGDESTLEREKRYNPFAGSMALDRRDVDM